LFYLTQALFALKKIHDDGGHFLQEILVQSFRAKKHTAMEHHPEPGLDELVWTCAVARLVFGSDVCIQSPPNLTPEADDTKGDSGGTCWVFPKSGGTLFADWGARN
jgi:FO synthase|tara:strand:- start:9789 stop:10106 length:318 start_codon:yes stop_codon:yes gene_type:complete